ncbi:MAG TPA: SDR family oxidoreductase [Acidimicrobiia bacterium]|jgi:NAD(P)-dependent dehydrogenase (short-subunit alcohol dehydrogenase family)
MLQDEIAVVTGSTGGIGEAVAHELAAEGARVVVTGRRAEEGERVAADIVAGGGTARFLRADLTVADEVEALFAETAATFGPVTVLVNNAAPTDLVGPSNKDGRLTDVAPDRFDEILAVGLRAAYLCCYHGIPQMQEAGRGSIVNVSSVAGVKATPRVFAYATAKGGLQALTRSVAADYARDGIRCNTVIVGFVISNPLARKFAEDEKMSRAMRATMLTDFGEPEDIAHVVRFLASAESRFLSGTDVYADGGATVKHVIPGTKQEARAE